jgi:hypothetical protein
MVQLLFSLWVGCGWTLAAQRPRRWRESGWKNVSRTMQFRKKRRLETSDCDSKKPKRSRFDARNQKDQKHYEI